MKIDYAGYTFIGKPVINFLIEYNELNSFAGFVENNKKLELFNKKKVKRFHKNVEKNNEDEEWNKIEEELYEEQIFIHKNAVEMIENNSKLQLDQSK